MTFDPIAGQLAVNAARATARSALPDAPVVPDRPRRPRRQRSDALRAALARRLHSTARWVEPAPRRTPQVG